jgi:hypothetical protein
MVVPNLPARCRRAALSDADVVAPPSKVQSMTVAASPSGRSLVALAAVCLSSLMFGLEISSVPAILPTLEQVMHADFAELQWIMNAYTIAVTVVLMATGTLADRFGRKRVFLIASVVAFGHGVPDVRPDPDHTGPDRRPALFKA